MCPSVDVTKLRDMLLLNEARHCHGNRALCSQPDAKPLNYIFLAESTSIASGLQSNETVGEPDASPPSPTFQQSPKGDKGGEMTLGVLVGSVRGGAWEQGWREACPGSAFLSFWSSGLGLIASRPAL